MMVAETYTYRYAPLGELRRLGTTLVARAWLGPCEREVYAQFRPSPRRDNWLLGRFLAKQLVLEQQRNGTLKTIGDHSVAPTRIEVRSGGARGRRLRPRLLVDGRLMPWSLSISHTERAVLAVLAVASGISVGADLVEPECYGRGFAELWFTPAERDYLRSDGDRGLAAALWAAKEAVFKATSRGEPFRPQSLEILADRQRGFVCRPAGSGAKFSCNLMVWRTPQRGIAAIAIQTRGASPPAYGEPHD
jgi:hypothetical protein